MHKLNQARFYRCFLRARWSNQRFVYGLKVIHQNILVQQSRTQMGVCSVLPVRKERCNQLVYTGLLLIRFYHLQILFPIITYTNNYEKQDDNKNESCVITLSESSGG